MKVWQKLINSTVLLLGCCLAVSAQNPAVPAPSNVREIDSEASEVLSAAQNQVKQLPADEQQKVLSTLGNRLPAGFLVSMGFTDPTNLINSDTNKLPLSQKDFLIGQIETTQQLVDPGMNPSPTTGDVAKGILDTFKSSRPLNDTELQKYTASLQQLPSLARSIGRLLWTDGSGSWTFEGTVFVTKTNTVATACHVVKPVIDVVGGQVVMKNGVTAVVDFSDTELPKLGPLPLTLHTYPVMKVLALGSQQGCDIAVLQIQGADSIPALNISTVNAPNTRLLVVGYPQLTDLSPLVCQYAIDPTDKYFCAFRSAHSGIAKVSSPGSEFSMNSHDGVSVFTYSATTRGGQSGSPVFELETLQVIGIHYCCTGGADGNYGLACATWHPQNLHWNEAISSATLASDGNLKDFFQVANQASSARQVLEQTASNRDRKPPGLQP
jgi:hypothetical protein